MSTLKIAEYWLIVVYAIASSIIFVDTYIQPWHIMQSLESVKLNFGKMKTQQVWPYKVTYYSHSHPWY